MFKRTFRKFSVQCLICGAAAVGGAGGPGTRILHAAFCDRRKESEVLLQGFIPFILLVFCNIGWSLQTPGGPDVKNLPAMPETSVRPPRWEDDLEEGMATHSSILAWRIPMDRGAWQRVGYEPLSTL